MNVVICHSCDGTGETREDVGTHNSDYVYYKCTKCNGTGRVKTRSYSYSVPYDMDHDKICKVDSEIINLIRKLESKSYQIDD